MSCFLGLVLCVASLATIQTLTAYDTKMVLREQFPVAGWALTPELRSILAMQVRLNGRVGADISFQVGGR